MTALATHIYSVHYSIIRAALMTNCSKKETEKGERDGDSESLGLEETLGESKGDACNAMYNVGKL